MFFLHAVRLATPADYAPLKGGDVLIIEDCNYDSRSLRQS